MEGYQEAMRVIERERINFLNKIDLVQPSFEEQHQLEVRDRHQQQHLIPNGLFYLLRAAVASTQHTHTRSPIALRLSSQSWVTFSKCSKGVCLRFPRSLCRRRSSTAVPAVRYVQILHFDPALNANLRVTGQASCGLDQNQSWPRR